MLNIHIAIADDEACMHADELACAAGDAPLNLPSGGAQRWNAIKGQLVEHRDNTTKATATHDLGATLVRVDLRRTRVQVGAAGGSTFPQAMAVFGQSGCVMIGTQFNDLWDPWPTLTHTCCSQCQVRFLQ